MAEPVGHGSGSDETGLARDRLVSYASNTALAWLGDGALGVAAAAMGEIGRNGTEAGVGAALAADDGRKLLEDSDRANETTE